MKAARRERDLFKSLDVSAEGKGWESWRSESAVRFAAKVNARDCVVGHSAHPDCVFRRPLDVDFGFFFFFLFFKKKD